MKEHISAAERGEKKMTTTVSNSSENSCLAKNPLSPAFEIELSKKICWHRVIKLPAITLLLIVLASLSISGHTYYVEADTKQISAHADRVIEKMVQGR